MKILAPAMKSLISFKVENLMKILGIFLVTLLVFSKSMASEYACKSPVDAKVLEVVALSQVDAKAKKIVVSILTPVATSVAEIPSKSYYALNSPASNTNAFVIEEAFSALSKDKAKTTEANLTLAMFIDDLKNVKTLQMFLVDKKSKLIVFNTKLFCTKLR